MGEAFEAISREHDMTLIAPGPAGRRAVRATCPDRLTCGATDAVQGRRDRVPRDRPCRRATPRRPSTCAAPGRDAGVAFCGPDPRA